MARFGFGVSAAVVRDGQILLGLRTGRRGAGTWSIPGGAIERGELPHRAAIRELREETGLIGRRAVPICITATKLADAEWITIHFQIQANGEPQVMEPDKFIRIGWFSELPEPLFPPFHDLIDSGWDFACL